VKQQISSILVALDSSSGSGKILKPASELAHRAHAELKAVYVEDIEWFEASKYEFTQLVSSYTGTVIPFSEKHITKHSRALGSTLQNLFVSVSEQKKIKYSYHSSKGVVSKELLDAALEAGLIIINRTSHIGIPKKKIIGGTARYLIENSIQPVLIWNDKLEWPRNVIGLCYNSMQGKEIIEWTVYIGRLLDQKIRFLFPSEESLATIEQSNKDKWLLSGEELRNFSEFYSEITLELLGKYKDTLFIVRRSELMQDPADLLSKLLNPVLFI